MMKNRSGFAITSVIYSLLVLFLALILLILSNLASRKVLFDKEKRDILSKLEQPLLPRSFHAIAYIESSGVQYIDTGISPTNTTHITMEFQFVDITDLQARLFGTTSVKDINNNVSYGFYINGNGNLAYSYQDGIGNWKSTGIPADTNKHIVDINPDIRKLTIDEREFNLQGEITRIGNKTLTLMKNNGEASSDFFSKARIYEVIIEDGEIKKHFIPCYQETNAGNIIGLYDIINDQFYTNQGTGNFIAGPDK